MVRALVGNALAQTLQNLESVTAGVITVFVASLQLVFIVLDMLPRNWLNCYIYMKIIVWFSTDAKNVRGSETSSQGFCQKHKNGCLILRRGKIMKLWLERAGTKVIALLQRFYDLGQVKLPLNGVEIKTFQMKWRAEKRAGEPRTDFV
ncbi:hypothetical protein Bca52824_046250 [Brassica carinata]|uniref:Uncharacterized protein n=1 Tax=Brassica carinata TaxID=52824 RepID=A0A8X7RE03_BRACI|nr:hypothetical protein Bca52824_046250 [Brassica carinata]